MPGGHAPHYRNKITGLGAGAILPSLAPRDLVSGVGQGWDLPGACHINKLNRVLSIVVM